MRYVLPAGMHVEELPKGGRVESAHIVFVQTVTQTANGFIVDEDTSMLSRRIPVAEYRTFREATIAADRLMKRKIRILSVGGRP
jgi:hypothetical protein